MADNQQWQAAAAKAAWHQWQWPYGAIIKAKHGYGAPVIYGERQQHQKQRNWRSAATGIGVNGEKRNERKRRGGTIWGMATAATYIRQSAKYLA